MEAPYIRARLEQQAPCAVTATSLVLSVLVRVSHRRAVMFLRNALSTRPDRLLTLLPFSRFIGSKTRMLFKHRCRDLADLTRRSYARLQILRAFAVAVSYYRTSY